MKPKMSQRSTFIVNCCAFSGTYAWKHEALDALAVHIKSEHHILWKRLEKSGRKLAMGNNGCGYYDDGRSKNGDWHRSDAAFRRTWIIESLEEYTKKY